ncbi:MAG TPA: bifunctional (p)ppGpp synthetase/guanosine-3',5'-bis(diphosphate) 3'-pyrophosphohydrolase [Anaerolineaceae bacterium]|nr:bifunctional (p)ppGpp synthetase/guanosine-3',5'-bis(diphosphate) 3'-pyrophosphohydrolase [Anaerolineaceae bacterium]
MISTENLSPLLENLMEVLPENFSVIDREFIIQAYNYAEEAHRTQKRASGEPYITHCVAVAIILAELKVQPVVVAAGLLHDTVEDTPITLEDIKRDFGDEVARLVDGVTKLTHLPRVSRADQHDAVLFENQESRNHDEKEELLDSQLARDRRRDLANETLRKTFLAMGEDIRVILIKLADRLHNMRTLGFMPERKRKRIAQETLDIFAPLANRLGIWQLKWELEDLGLRHTNPEKYKEIAQNLAETRVERERQMKAITDRIAKLTSEAGIKIEISGRSKHIYSIYRKMADKNKPFEQVRDLRGVRLIVPDIPSCYAVLGIIHTHWRPIPTEFDDYIAAPKDNFYQSLHTAVLYDDGKPLEVQIRTPEMNQNAEYGIAAHWRYKEKGPRDENYEQRINWLKKVMEWRQEVEDANEFVDGMKTDVFKDRVYVFTPRGDIIDLPAGATPIDFAYTVHTEIGNRCRGAKVNGKLVSLDYALKTGEQVEVLTAKQGGPSRDWLNSNLGLVKTQRARSKIKAWFKHQNREQNLAQGKELLEREFRRVGLVNYDLDNLAKAFDYRSLDDLYVAVGCGDVSLGHIINTLSEGQASTAQPFEIKPSQPKDLTENAVAVLGLRNILTNFARCCNPVPGDEIVGYITRGRGATIHRQDCPNILRTKDRDRIVRVTWGEPQHTFPVEIQIKAYDRQGLMGDISSLLNNENINLKDIKIDVTHNLASIMMVVEVADIAQLSRILTKIENIPNVMEAHRLNPG